MASSDGMKYFELARVKSEGEPFALDPADDLLVHATERYAFGFYDWRGVFGSHEAKLQEVALGYTVTYEKVWKAAKPHIWVPAAIAGVIIKNPTVTRRFWQGWLK